MSDFLLLKDRSLCPKCFSRQRNTYNRKCSNCGMMLFVMPIDFAAYEADGNSREWWLFNSVKGWQHRSHIILGEIPLERRTPELNTKPVTETAEERIAKVRAETRVKMKIPNRKVFGRGKSITRL